MRTRFPQFRVMAVVTGFAMVSAICGAAPQEGRVPHPQTSAPREGQNAGPATASRPPQAVEERGPGVQRAASQRSNYQVPARVRRVGFYPGTRTVVLPGFVRCSTLPTAAYWGTRDLMAEIQWLSRKGFIPVSAIGDSVDLLTDYTQQPAGWRAYGVSVPAGGSVQVEVQHPKLGWFRLMLVDRWGTPGPGMLQAAIAPQPVMVTYRNPGKVATAVYVIVDDPAWWSDAKDPYTLLVRRDWDPATTDLSHVKMVAGLWGATPSVSAQFRGPSLTGPAVFPR